MKTKINLPYSLAALFFASAFFLNVDVVLANEEVPVPGWIAGLEDVAPKNSAPVEIIEIGSVDAKESASFYNKTFVISAYYSPIQGQNKYVTGSLAGDIRLNGSGVNGADGTGVYPGMIAAPSTYAFGTKMEIPGIGTVAVHDRGGAIKNNRLDVWMGYGDVGLQRAIKWGKRSVNVKVYGINADIKEAVVFGDIETVNNVPQSPVTKSNLFSRELKLGAKGDDVMW